MRAQPDLLIVEDDDLLAAAYAEFVRDSGCRISLAATGAEALARMGRQRPDIVLLDLRLPDMHGLELLARLGEFGQTPKVVIITSEDSADSAMEAVRLGAYDYMLKPVDQHRLELTVNHLVERLQLERRLDSLQVGTRDRFAGFVGGSAPMQVIYRIIENVAGSDATVFITGESGTGKEVAAEAIHRHSRRAQGPLVTLNCAAIPGELLESEVFGHVKGAFTGAVAARAGAAERADGGTLFLDEVCEMAPELQTKLLRFIQTRRFQRVGDNREMVSDVRFVCATNRDPWAEVEAGRFREDLYYRLFVVPLPMPPLRERGDDVLRLANHFLTCYAADEGKHFTGLTDDARAALLEHPLPGNVRQLQNVVRRAVVLHPGGVVTAAMLGLSSDLSDRGPGASPWAPAVQPATDQVVQPPEPEVDLGPTSIRPLDEVERETIEAAIALCGGSVAEAARRLGVSDSTLYRKRLRWHR